MYMSVHLATMFYTLFPVSLTARSCDNQGRKAVLRTFGLRVPQVPIMVVSILICTGCLILLFANMYSYYILKHVPLQRLAEINTSQCSSASGFPTHWLTPADWVHELKN